MKEILFPKNIALPGTNAKGEPVELDYSLPSFVVEFVLSDLRWVDEWAPGFESFAAKFSQSAKGARLTDVEHERALRALRDSSMAPQLRIHLMRFWHAFTLAKDVVPEVAREEIAS